MFFLSAMNEMTESTPPADDPSPAAVAMARTAAFTERSVDSGMRAARENPVGAMLVALGLGLLIGSLSARRRAARRAEFFERPAEGMEALLAGAGRRAVDKAAATLRRLLHLT